MLSAGVRTPVQRLDAPLLHERRHLPAADLQPILPQPITQPAGTGKRRIEVPFVDSPHQRQIAL
jgi:hypothetical protein